MIRNNMKLTPSIATATGAALFAKVQMVGGVITEGFLPADIGRPLGKQLDKYLARLKRRAALKALAKRLHDPDDPQSTWKLAQQVECLLLRFKAAGYDRVKSGGRAATDIEGLLIALIEIPGAKCAEKIHKQLQRFLTEPG